MKNLTFLGFMHCSGLEDFYYLLWEDHAVSESYKPHYVKVYAVIKSQTHKQELIDTIEPWLYLTEAEVDAAIEEDKL